MHNTDDALRYPIGKFVPRETYSRDESSAFIQIIEDLPSKIEEVVKNFDSLRWNTAYRPGGWTARQVVHHLADSPMNAYIRVKWALTEDTPLIKAYDEKRWAETPEVALDPAISLNLLKALHTKFAALLRSIDERDLTRQFLHPETGKHVSIQRMLALYSWHGEHHLGHLRIVARA